MQRVDGANALTRRWVEQLSGSTNHVLSGAGAWVVLASALAGADGAARSELEAALGVDLESAAERARALSAALGTHGLSALLALWTAPEIEVKDSYRAALGVEVATGGAPSQGEADAWVREGTDGLLDTCPIEVRPDTLLLLLGIVTADGAWERSFGPAIVDWHGGQRDAAQRIDPDTAVADLLDAGDQPDDATAVSRVRLTTTEGFEVHLLAGPESMAAGEVLARGIDAAHVRPATSLGAAAGVLRRERVPAPPAHEGSLRILVPIFSIRERHDLLERADLFGLVAASDDSSGHFPLISDVPLYVQAAAQGAVAELSTEGFRAAAATALGMARAAGMLPSAEIERISAVHDRPFGFLVVEPETGVVAFAGWVADPAAT